ncbi:MAG: hypothetical protein HY320_03570 [Armatimonadetes bacterium]|nr:hypothetical protein [Armatimonadota bacterium]
MNLCKRIERVEGAAACRLAAWVAARSDEELIRLWKEGQAPAPIQAIFDELAAMSDEELLASLAGLGAVG